MHRSVSFNIYGSINSCLHKAQGLMNCGNGGNIFLLRRLCRIMERKQLIQDRKRMYQHWDKTKVKPQSLANGFVAISGISFTNDH